MVNITYTPCSVLRGRESPAAISLRHTETNLCQTGVSLSDCHTENEPPPFSTQASAIKNDFFKTLFYVFNKRFTKNVDAVAKKLP